MAFFSFVYLSINNHKKMTKYTFIKVKVFAYWVLTYPCSSRVCEQLLWLQNIDSPNLYHAGSVQL